MNLPLQAYRPLDANINIRKGTSLPTFLNMISKKKKNVYHGIYSYKFKTQLLANSFSNEPDLRRINQ